MILAPDTSSAKHVTVGASSTQFGLTMEASGVFIVISTTDAFIAQGVSPTAAANADGSILLPANVGVPILGRAGAKLAIIQKTAGGDAWLTRATTF